MMSILKLFCYVDDLFQWLVTRENAKLSAWLVSEGRPLVCA